MKKDRLEHYALGVFPLIFLTSILYLLGTSWFSILFFFVSYAWAFALLTPNFNQKVLSRKYRYSFLRLVLNVNVFFQDLLSGIIPSSFIRVFSPFSFCLIMFMIASYSGNLIFSVLGSLVFDVIYLTYHQVKLRKKIFSC